MTRRALLVDDEPDIRLIARAALMRSGFDVLTAQSGLEALTVAAREPLDVILLDCMLPDLDGFETCTRLKNDSSTRPVPVVFLTGRTKPADVSRCMAVGALGCIAKPFNPLTLGDQVKALLGSLAGTPEPTG
jgi:DNA-binding response OmpR family regulator